MPTISLANPKGGSGKTTSALLLALEIARRGRQVTILDADPAQWISKWFDLPGRPENITVVADVTDDDLIDRAVEAAEQSSFVIIDLEGTANMAVSHAIMISDLVLVPVQGSTMDAQGAVKTVKLIRRQARGQGRPIPHSALLTRTGAIQTRELKDIIAQFAEAGIPCAQTQIMERAAYKSLFSYGGDLPGLDPKAVSGIARARENAESFAREVVALLKANQEERVDA